MRCEKCGYTHIPNIGDGRCPMCGWVALTRVYEEIEVTDGTDNAKKKIRLHSEGNVYYEYDPSSSPFREDAWGAYYLGKCYSKTGPCLLKEVVICSNAPRWYVNSMWELLKSFHLSEITQKVFIPIIDLVDAGRECFLIEDFFDGVSLYDLMHGQVCGVDGQPFEFANKMYDMYQNRRTDFVKMVIKEILVGIKLIHTNNIPITYIELPENIIFTKSREIKIRLVSSLLYSCKKQFTLIPWVYDALSPKEFNSPEYYHDYGRHFDERSEIYTLGIFAYCILIGHLPNKGGATLEDCHRAHGPIKDPRDDDYVNKPFVFCDYHKLFLDEIEDKHLHAIIAKATRLNPDKRYQSAEEVIDALEGNVDNDDNVENTYIEKTIPWYKKIASILYGMFRIKDVS